MQKNSSSPIQATTRSHRVALVGARGYSGLECARLLLQHPEAQLVGCFSADPAFQLAHCLPEAEALQIPTWSMQEFEQKLQHIEVLFLATPAEVSVELAPLALQNNVHVIDFSGAFRLKQGAPQDLTEKYQRWYGMKHPAIEILEGAQYGLQPFSQPTTSKGAQLIANPGCFATACLMALVPLLKSGQIDADSIVVDAKSGTSGAGRKANENLLFTEVDGECLPYKVGQHQHLPEIAEATCLLTEASIEPFFTTHLINVRRGIIASIYANLNNGVTEQDITASFQKAYGDYPLVRFGALGTPETDRLLSLKRVVGTNRTHISYRVGQRDAVAGAMHASADVKSNRNHKLYLFSLIDNLLKGAAGQALENFNRLIDRPCSFGMANREGVL